MEANDVSTQLFTAEQELQTLEVQKTSNNPDNLLNNDPTYITLTAKINALEAELDIQMNGNDVTTGLANLIATGDIYNTDYQNTMAQVNRITTALAEAGKQLSDLQNQAEANTSNSSLAGEVDTLRAQTDVDYLNAKLTALRNKMTLIAQQSVDGMNQPDPVADFEKTSVALAEAKQELAAMVSQASHDTMDRDLDHQLVQAQIDNLNSQLSDLTAKATSLLKNENTAIPDYLVAGSPSIPLPVLPERTRARNALMMGALVGIAGAWVLLNRRWIAKGMPSSKTSTPEKHEEDEA